MVALRQLEIMQRVLGINGSLKSIWLVVWNMNFILPYIVINDPD
jgi:hypothetical protein